MRIAILVLAIIGSIVCLGLGTCQTVCAGCQGSCAAMFAGTPRPPTKSGSSSSGGSGGLDEMGTALGTLALANLCSGIGLVLQAILGLIGGIMAFSKLGKGEKGKIGGVLLSAGVGITLLATLIGIIIVAGIDETILPNASDQIFNLLITLVVGALLHAIALIMAFMAKPLGAADQP